MHWDHLPERQKYTFVWRKTVERNRARLIDKVKALLAQVDDCMAQENTKTDETVEFDKVLLVDAEGAVKVGAPTVDGAKVVCEVAEELVKGEHVICFQERLSHISYLHISTQSLQLKHLIQLSPTVIFQVAYSFTVTEAVSLQQKLSENGLRVLAFACRETEEELTKETECHLTFLGLVAMMDPPRPESVEAVKNAIRAGIRPVMITGDHKITAIAIAKEIGIYHEGDMALTGMELDAMSEETLAQDIEKISVYARVSPENKIRIVEAWQNKGKIVSMTGDGVDILNLYGDRFLIEYVL